MEKKTTIGDVVAFLDERFRPELQEEYDNAGFVVGERDAEYRGTIVALDVTREVVEEAVETGANLIVTHHPMIFRGMKRITDSTEAGRMVMRLVREGIGVYAAHTNLDNVPWGVNGVLAEKLGLQHCRILKKMDDENGAGMVGDLKRRVKADVFLRRVKEVTGQGLIRTSAHDGERRISRVAICGGAGSFLIGEAMAAGADLYLTADLKYHDFERPEGGMILADGGHYETEQFAKEIIYSAISEKFSNFACRISRRQGSLVQYI